MNKLFVYVLSTLAGIMLTSTMLAQNNNDANYNISLDNNTYTIHPEAIADLQETCGVGNGVYTIPPDKLTDCRKKVQGLLNLKKAQKIYGSCTPGPHCAKQG